MADKSVNVIRSIFELIVLLIGLGIVFGGFALIVFLSPWSSTIIERALASDVRYFIELLAFLAIAAIIALLSVMSVASSSVVHSALYLLATFAGVAALYISMNAPFLGVAQVLVYIGAVGVLLLFAVMLTRKTIMEDSHGEL